MPLFHKKFESKPIPSRMGRCTIGCAPITEDLDDYKNITLNLGNKEIRFADGIWIYSSRKSDADDVARLNRRIHTLEEENNMANLKMEVFLDILTENVNEMNNLKKCK